MIACLTCLSLMTNLATHQCGIVVMWSGQGDTQLFSALSLCFPGVSALTPRQRPRPPRPSSDYSSIVGPEQGEPPDIASCW